MTLRELVERLRLRFGGVGREPRLKEAVLRQRVADAQAVGAMMESPGWNIYREAVLAQIEADKTELLALPSDKVFAAVEVIRLQQSAVGRQAALNAAALIVRRGVEAEEELERLEAAKGGRG